MSVRKFRFLNIYLFQEVLTDEEYAPQDFDTTSLNNTAKALYLYNNNVATKIQNYLKKNFNRSIIEVKKCQFIHEMSLFFGH